MGHRLRVLTANLWNGRVDARGFADLVEALGADVVAAQELSPEQADALGAVLPHGCLEPRRDNTGMGIALRRPAAALAPLPLPYRAAQRALLEPADWAGLPGPCEVLNVHVMGVHVWPQWRALRIRLGQLRELERFLDGAARGPRLLLGDLNTPPSWPAYRRLTARLADAALLAARRRGTRPARTWRPWPGLPRLFRLDHALVEGLEVEEVQVVDVPRGDHFAVVADVAVPAAEP